MVKIFKQTRIQTLMVLAGFFILTPLESRAIAVKTHDPINSIDGTDVPYCQDLNNGMNNFSNPTNMSLWAYRGGKVLKSLNKFTGFERTKMIKLGLDQIFGPVDIKKIRTVMAINFYESMLETLTFHPGGNFRKVNVSFKAKNSEDGFLFCFINVSGRVIEFTACSEIKGELDESKAFERYSKEDINNHLLHWAKFNYSALSLLQEIRGQKNPIKDSDTKMKDQLTHCNELIE